MKDSSKRSLHYHIFGSPTPDDPGYKEFMDRANQMNIDPKFKRKMREMGKKAFSIAYTQAFNGLDFLQDKELRYFAQEYNSRTWDHGLGSMPSSFRVLEGFYEWRPDLFMFQIFEEVEHLFSVFDFVDYLTSDLNNNDIDYFLEHVEDDLIYSYNILNDVNEITFKTKDSLEYVIGGVSILKRKNEAYIMLIAGEKGNTDKFNDDFPHETTAYARKSYIKSDQSLKRGAVKLFDKKDIWKVNLYMRIDLLTKTIDLRYIQKDMGNMLSTITDDIGMLASSLDRDRDYSTYIKDHVKQVENYDAVFEFAYKCLHLPEYFNIYDDILTQEIHPTRLFGEKLRTSVLPGKTSYNHQFFIKTREVWVLDLAMKPSTSKMTLPDSELTIQKEGYWKQLEPGQIGTGKNGEIIHGRTWVNQMLSWYQKERIPQSVEIATPSLFNENSGYIYIMRNASHEINIFKIGLTTKTVEERAGQLSATTSSPDKYLIVHRWKVKDVKSAEKLIHDQLKEYRINERREFFRIDLEKVIPVIGEVVEMINNIVEN
jgi:hypothetical protein